jgi:hypothetical protein
MANMELPICTPLSVIHLKNPPKFNYTIFQVVEHSLFVFGMWKRLGEG